MITNSEFTNPANMALFRVGFRISYFSGYIEARTMWPYRFANISPPETSDLLGNAFKYLVLLITEILDLWRFPGIQITGKRIPYKLSFQINILYPRVFVCFRLNKCLFCNIFIYIIFFLVDRHLFLIAAKLATVS